MKFSLSADEAVALLPDGPAVSVVTPAGVQVQFTAEAVVARLRDAAALTLSPEEPACVLAHEAGGLVVRVYVDTRRTAALRAERARRHRKIRTAGRLALTGASTAAACVLMGAAVARFGAHVGLGVIGLGAIAVARLSERKDGGLR